MKKIIWAVIMLALCCVLALSGCGNGTNQPSDEHQTTGNGVNNSEQKQPSEGLKYTLNPDSESYSVSGIGTCKDKDVVIPPTYNGKPVTGIGDSAFNNCTGLTSVTIPDTVTSIGKWAFNECTGLTSIIFEGTKSQCNAISKGEDWNYNTGAYSIHCTDGDIAKTDNNKTDISEGSTGCQHSLGDWVQTKSPTCTEKGEEKRSCAKCDYVETRETAMIDHEFVDDVCKNCGQRKPSGGLQYTYDSNSDSYSVLDIGTCTDTDVVIPSTYLGKPVTSIGHDAFDYCTWLTSVTIPDSVTSIGIKAFERCTGLASITIHDSVTKIGDCAFYECTRLASITIPDSVTRIGDLAFYDCRSLTSITFEGTKAQWNAISKGDHWDSDTGAYIIHCTDGDI